MIKAISVILLVFILIWTYNLFINNFIILEETGYQPYKGIINIADISWNEICKDNYSGWLMQKIRAFERRNPGVYIELDLTNVNSLYSGIVNNTLDYMPDIVPVRGGFPNFDALESLDVYFDKEELDLFRQNVLKSLTLDKELFAIPIGIGTKVMYINVDKFHERNISPPMDENLTYEEFISYLEQLTYDSDENGTIDSYGFITGVGADNYNIWGILLSDGAELINLRRMEYNFYGEKAIKGLEKVIKLKDKYKVVPDYFGIINENDAWEMFFKEEKAAVTIEGAWASNTLENAYKNGEGFNFDIINYPIGDKGLPVIFSNDIISYGITKKDDPKRIEMCIKFLKYLTNESSQRSLDRIGLFTVRHGIKDMYKENIRMRKIGESIDYTTYLPLIKNWTEIYAIVQEEISNAILGEKESYQAIEDAKNRVEELK